MFKITALTAGVRDKSRVNVWIDGKFRFSLSLAQVADFHLRSGRELDADELAELEEESAYGKVYIRALEHVLARPRSKKELHDYLWRKTVARKVRTKDGAVVDKPGVSKKVVDRVEDALIQKGHVNDEKFARYWVENRNLRRGISMKKISLELYQKGIDKTIIDRIMKESGRSDEDELVKIINKKASRYDDPRKLIAYLARQGFAYDDINRALSTRAEIEASLSEMD